MELVSYKDVEVRPEAINLIVAAFEVFPSIGQKYLIKHGILPPATRIPQPSPYIPLTSWLAALQEILNDVGPNALFKLGAHIINNPYLPPDLTDLETRLREIDVAFHMSHRKGGKPMFNQVTKKMLDGIGNFTVERPGKEKLAFVRCDTPYPCPLEHGIVSGVAVQVEPRAVVVHHDPRICRMTGAPRCCYSVRW